MNDAIPTRDADETPLTGRDVPVSGSPPSTGKGRVVFLVLAEGVKAGPERLRSMPAFPALLLGIQGSLEQRGMGFSMVQYDGHGALPPELTASDTVGILILGSLAQMPAKLRRALLDVPSVWVMRQNSDFANEFDHVFYDNYAVGSLAAHYLLARKHHHVGYITPDIGHQAFSSRRDTFVHAIQWGGGRVTVFDLTLEETSHSTAEGIRRAIREMVAMPARPTALFVPSDSDLLDAFKALKGCGIEPMKDIDLIGCNNDTLYLNQMIPRPATIDIKLELVGRRAVDQVVARLENPSEASRVQVFISPVLIVPGPDGTGRQQPFRPRPSSF